MPLHMMTCHHTPRLGPQIWERNFRRADWLTLFDFIHKSTICYSQENYFKILSRWYRDPLTLHTMFPSTPASCWHYGTASGTYLHVWWESKRIRPFWTHLIQIYSTIYEEPLTPTPVIARLYIYGIPEKVPPSFLPVCSMAAHPIIMGHDHYTLLSLWVSTVNDIRRMEEMLSLDNSTFDKYKVLRFVWLCFSSCETLATMLSTPTGSSPYLP